MTDSLSERTAALAGPDRAVDAEVAVALSDAPDARVVWMKGQRWFSKPGPGRIPFAGCGGKGVRLGLIFQQKRFTVSLDAAMTVVPDGWHFYLESKFPHAAVENRLDGREVYAAAPTPALALLSAALKARGL